PRLRPGGGGSGGSEPERRRDVFPGEAAVLHRGRVDLQLRPGRGAQLLGIQLGRARFFYSRRIGRAPQGSVPSADFSDMPVGAHILGALKMTGKAAGSWNVGALSAVTGRETAQLDTAGTLFKKEVEPLTYYGVFRVQKEFPDG